MAPPEYDWIKKRGKALEESFFAERDRHLLESLRRQITSTEAKQVLAAATGVMDEMVLPELQDLPVPHFLAVMGLFPLVEVAWCDREVAEKERKAILAAAADMGVTVDSPSFVLLERWLESRPAEDALKLWTDYVQAICATLEPSTVAKLRDSVMGRARKIALAAGGIFGMGYTISAEEQQCLQRLNDAFAPPEAS